MTEFTERRHVLRREQDRLTGSEVDNLKRALATRHVIGMAQGMLMLRYGLSEQHAFDYLTRRSMESNTKVRDVVHTVIQELLGEQAQHLD